MERPTPTKDAAVHRLAKSITQMTLCRGTTSEVDDATKLLEKARQKLQGIQNIPPQRVSDIEATIRQLRQIGCILDSCTISACYEVTKHCWAGPLTKTTAKTTNHHGPSKGCRSNTAQCGNQGSPSQDFGDHREQPSWHNSHSDTLKQTPTTPTRNKVVRKLPQWNRRVKHGLRWKRRRGNSTQGTLRVRSVLLFQSSYCIKICE